MSTIVGFSKYVSTTGKAQQIAAHAGQEVTLGLGLSGEVKGDLLSVTFSDEEGWLAYLTGGENGYGWVYVSDVTYLFAEGEPEE